MKKVLIILGITGLVILIVLGWRTRDYWWQKYQANKVLNEFAALDNVYKNDNYGSTTPEGTLVLFVDALKKGDAELASRYFVPEKRELGLNQVRIILTSKRAEEVTKELTSYKNKHFSSDMLACVFSTYHEEERFWSETDLRLNKYTNKWLIKSL